MLESRTLSVEGMKCGGCENSVVSRVQALTGVARVTASARNKEVSVEFDNAKMDINHIVNAIKQAGYVVK